VSDLIVHERQPTYITDVLNVQMQRIRKRTTRDHRLTAIHVGAYDGSWDMTFAARHKPIIMHCFEPQKTAFKKHKRRTDRYPHINLYRKAIGAESGTSVLYANGKLDQGASIVRDFVTNRTVGKLIKEEVKVTTIGDFCAEKVINRLDLLRVNCEGSEYAIFQDGVVDFLRFTNVVCVTLHGKTPVFLSPEINTRKIEITRLFIQYGFDLLCGHNFVEVQKIPVSHSWQVWAKKKFIV